MIGELGHRKAITYAKATIFPTFLEFTGWLKNWLLGKTKQKMAKNKELVDREQVEGANDYDEQSFDEDVVKFQQLGLLGWTNKDSLSKETS